MLHLIPFRYSLQLHIHRDSVLPSQEMLFPYLGSPNAQMPPADFTKSLMEFTWLTPNYQEIQETS